jgi:hemolysin III
VAVCGVLANCARPSSVAVEHHAHVLGQPVRAKSAHDACFVRRVDHPAEPALPVSHVTKPYSSNRTFPVALRGYGYIMTPRTERLLGATAETTAQVAGRLGEQVREVLEVLEEVNPKLRGLLHAATAPLALVAGIVLVVLSPTASSRVGSAVFATSALVLFTVSAIYHRGSWSPRVWLFLRRFDHANIFLLIAGSYTPFTLLLLRGGDRATLLTVVWTGALLGVGFRIFWNDAPRWLYTPIYVALGWVSIFFFGDFAATSGTAVMIFLVLGGALYTLGGVVYGFKRPNPSLRWYGFHEVFHTLTIAAFISHYIGISIATYSLR